MNPFPELAINLFDRIAFLEFIVFYLKTSLNNLSEQVQEAVEGNRIRSDMPLTATVLNIRDLTEWPPDRWERSYPAGRHYVTGESYSRFKDDFVFVQSAWAVSQAYEAFETFLLDSIGHVLMLDPEKANTSKLRNACGNSDTSLSLQDWMDCVREVFRKEDNPKIINFLGKHYSVLRQAETNNNRYTNLRHCLKIVGMIRHAVTHSSGIISTVVVNSLSLPEQDVLDRSFETDDTEGGLSLRISVDQARNALRLFAEYAYLIARTLSTSSGYQWKLGEPKSPNPELQKD